VLIVKKASNYILTNNHSLFSSIIPCLPGMRPGRRVKKEVLLLTDGLYNCGDDSEVVEASDALKQVADIYGMMIGISTEDGRQKLSKLVSTPLKDHLFAVEDLGQFSKLIIHLKDLINDGKLQCAPFQGPFPK
jgi:hypothetical protein